LKELVAGSTEAAANTQLTQDIIGMKETLLVKIPAGTD
jgi:hypothetical protein